MGLVWLTRKVIEEEIRLDQGSFTDSHEDWVLSIALAILHVFETSPISV